MSGREMLKLATGALLFATLAYAILMAPGLLSDSASMVPELAHQALR